MHPNAIDMVMLRVCVYVCASWVRLVCTYVHIHNIFIQSYHEIQRTGNYSSYGNPDKFLKISGFLKQKVIPNKKVFRNKKDKYLSQLLAQITIYQRKARNSTLPDK